MGFHVSPLSRLGYRLAGLLFVANRYALGQTGSHDYAIASLDCCLLPIATLLDKQGA